MASCSLWSARATRRWQSSRSARRGTPVNIRKPANAAAASAVFPKSESFKRCRIGVASSLTVFTITHRAHSRKAGENAKAWDVYYPYDGSFSLYLQGRGNRADVSVKVVTDNETDSIFSGCKIQGAAVGNTMLANRRQLLRGQMSLNFLAYGMIDRFAFGCFRKRYEVDHKMITFGFIDQRGIWRQVHPVVHMLLARLFARFNFLPAHHQRKRCVVQRGL